MLVIKKILVIVAMAAMYSACVGNGPPRRETSDRAATGKSDELGSCKGYCGKRSPDGCYCDDDCETKGDCCPDVEKICWNTGGGEASSGSDGGGSGGGEASSGSDGDSGNSDGGGSVNSDGGGSGSGGLENTSVGAVSRDDELRYCTGTVISPCTILTAAHCVGMFSPIEMAFELNGEPHQVYRYLKHPDYGDYRHDLALLILRAPLQKTPVAPLATAQPKINDQVLVVGFGGTKEDPRVGVKRISKEQVELVNSETFSVMGDNVYRKGDSGGPSFLLVDGQQTVVGVHSTYNDITSLGTDMTISVYRDWIINNMVGKNAVYGPGDDQDMCL